MKTPVIPEAYLQWRHCIEVERGIPLTPTFIDEHLAVWRNAGHDEARRPGMRPGPPSVAPG
jgi:hypothetical protein